MSDEQLLAAYRHDIHKPLNEPHETAPETVAGVPVNREPAYGADAMAARMSRPPGEPGEQLPGHETRYRRSLVTGESTHEEGTFSLQYYESAVRELATIGDAERMHAEWLESDLMGAFNEAHWYPYTSLKYHTLLVAALVESYRNGSEFDGLGIRLARAAEVTPHRTIFVYEGDDAIAPFTLDVVPNVSGETAKIRSEPTRNFADVWSRLPAHPFTDPGDRRVMVIDSTVRRIRSWSTGLQYLEDVLEEGPAQG